MKLFWAAAALLFSVSTWAGLPSATFTDLSLRKISEAWNRSADSFEVDIDPHPQPSPEAAYVWAVYMSQAFEQAGFSLEATLFKYLAESHPGSRQMHVFIHQLGLQNLIVTLSDPAFVNAYAQAGAVSQRIVDVVDAKDPKAPIREADYILEGAGESELSGFEEEFYSDYRQVGWLTPGEDNWAGWLIFSPGDFVNTSEGIGIVEISKLSEEKKSFYEQILGPSGKRKLKIEGVVLRYPGADRFFDLAEDIRLKTL